MSPPGTLGLVELAMLKIFSQEFNSLHFCVLISCAISTSGIANIGMLRKVHDPELCELSLSREKGFLTSI